MHCTKCSFCKVIKSGILGLFWLVIPDGIPDKYIRHNTVVENFVFECSRYYNCKWKCYWPQLNRERKRFINNTGELEETDWDTVIYLVKKQSCHWYQLLAVQEIISQKFWWYLYLFTYSSIFNRDGWTSINAVRQLRTLHEAMLIREQACTVDEIREHLATEWEVSPIYRLYQSEAEGLGARICDLPPEEHLQQAGLLATRTAAPANFGNHVTGWLIIQNQCIRFWA